MKVCTKPRFETEATGNSDITHYAEAQVFVLPFVNEIIVTGLTSFNLRHTRFLPQLDLNLQSLALQF